MADRLEETMKAVKELIRLNLAEFYTDANGQQKVRLTKLGKKVLNDIKH